MFAMVALGIGQILGSFYTGFIVDKCGSRIAAQQNCLNLALALVSVAFYLS
jgi:predicted MFS family arabinose efflux permease